MEIMTWIPEEKGTPSIMESHSDSYERLQEGCLRWQGKKKKINLRLFEVFRYIERSFRVLLINFGMNSSDKYLDNTAIKPRDND